jgi:hypothetical protein
MIYSKVLLLTVLTCAAPTLAAQKVNILFQKHIFMPFHMRVLTSVLLQPILYSEENCAGISHAIEPNAKCTIVPADL